MSSWFAAVPASYLNSRLLRYSTSYCVSSVLHLWRNNTNHGFYIDSNIRCFTLFQLTFLFNFHFSKPGFPVTLYLSASDVLKIRDLFVESLCLVFFFVPRINTIGKWNKILYTFLKIIYLFIFAFPGAQSNKVSQEKALSIIERTYV